MSFHVHYQERIEVYKGRYILVVDVLMPINEFLTFHNPEITESLLSNTSGSRDNDKGWMDNGVCCVTGAYLEHRVVGVICPGNFKHASDNLHQCLKDADLLATYKAQRYGI